MANRRNVSSDEISRTPMRRGRRGFTLRAVPWQAGARAGAVRCRLLHRYRDAHHRAAARAGARPAGGGREQARRRRGHCRGGGGESGTRRAYAPHRHQQPVFRRAASAQEAALRCGRRLHAYQLRWQLHFFVVVHPGVPARTLSELIAYAQANPGRLNYATGNTSGIVMTAMFASLARIDIVHVPYKSEPPAITDLLSGTVHLMFSSYATVAPHLREGKLRALVTTLPNRSPLLAEVPSIVEAGFPRFPIASWAGMFGPAGMPREVAERLNRELNALL